VCRGDRAASRMKAHTAGSVLLMTEPAVVLRLQLRAALYCIGCSMRLVAFCLAARGPSCRLFLCFFVLMFALPGVSVQGGVQLLLCQLATGPSSTALAQLATGPSSTALAQLATGPSSTQRCVLLCQGCCACSCLYGCHSSSADVSGPAAVGCHTQKATAPVAACGAVGKSQATQATAALATCAALLMLGCPVAIAHYTSCDVCPRPSALQIVWRRAPGLWALYGIKFMPGQVAPQYSLLCMLCMYATADLIAVNLCLSKCTTQLRCCNALSHKPGCCCCTDFVHQPRRLLSRRVGRDE
jgi:hypothetical protein